jgi:hypothetical protein
MVSCDPKCINLATHLGVIVDPGGLTHSGLAEDAMGIVDLCCKHFMQTEHDECTHQTAQLSAPIVPQSRDNPAANVSAHGAYTRRTPKVEPTELPHNNALRHALHCFKFSPRKRHSMPEELPIIGGVGGSSPRSRQPAIIGSNYCYRVVIGLG